MELTSIERKVHTIRGQKVLLDYDLAELYEVETRVLKQAVRRNLDRFPPDFMFELSECEITDLVSQIVIPSRKYLGGAIPFAFTEQGVAMLSSVLKSSKAIQVNIAIMRTFVIIRQYTFDFSELSSRLEQLEKEMNTKFSDIYQALNYLISPPAGERTKIGFKSDGQI